MKIEFGFDVKSINKAVKTLEKAKKDLQDKLVVDLLNGCCEWLIRRANENLEQVSIGGEIKSEIQANWQTSIIGNIAKITNIYDKAVYVEFGVGIVGAKNEHPNANKTSYWYDLPTEYKNAEGGWHFDVDDEAVLDLPKTAIITQDDNDDGSISIYTLGTQGALYAYNALVDLHDYGAKEVWEQVKLKYWG